MTMFFNAKAVVDIGKLIEENGEKFYKEAAKRASNSDLVCLFDYLAAEEKVHQQVFDELGERLAGQKGAPTAAEPGEEELYMKDLADHHVFNAGFEEIEKMIGEKVEGTKVLDLALRFEADSVKFFEQLKKGTPPEWGKDEIDKLIEQERNHVEKLTQLKKQMEEAG
jgi:rubrerythrin